MNITTGAAKVRVFSFVGISITSLSVTISKNGGAFGAVHGAGLASITGNFYKVTLDATDTNTIGCLAYKFSDTIIGVVVPNGDDVDDVVPVTVGGQLNDGSALISLSNLNVVSQSAGQPALSLTGNGAGAGIYCYGGDSGPGAVLSGGATGGNGLTVHGGGTYGSAIYADVNGATDPVLSLQNLANFSAMTVGDGGGLTLYAADNFDVININAASTNSRGIRITTQDGEGLKIDAAGTGFAAALIEAADGPGLTLGGVGLSGAFCIQNSDGPGVQIGGGGSGEAIQAFAGSSGHGISITSGSSSGSAINLVGTAGGGLTITAQGAPAISLTTLGAAFTFDIIGGDLGGIRSWTTAAGDDVPALLLQADNAGANGAFHVISNAGPGMRVDGYDAIMLYDIAYGAIMHLAGQGCGLLIDGPASSNAYGIYVRGNSVNGTAAIQVVNTFNNATLSVANVNAGLQLMGPDTNGTGLYIHGGATDGPGVWVSTTDGAGVIINSAGTDQSGLYISTGDGHGIEVVATGSSRHGIVATGGTGGVSDGMKLVAGTGGVPIRGNLFGTVEGLSAAGWATAFTTNSTKVYADAVTGSVVKEIASHASGGGGGLTQADVRTAVGLASANLDTQLSGINAKTTNLPADPAGLAGLASAHGSGSWATATGFAVAGDAMILTTPYANALIAAVAAQFTADHGSGSYVRNTEPDNTSIGIIATTIATVATNVTTIATNVANVQTRLPAALSGGKMDSVLADKTGFSLSSSGLNAVMVAGVALPTALRYIGATTTGELRDGAGSGVEAWRDFAGAIAVTVHVDGDGNRTEVEYA